MYNAIKYTIRYVSRSESVHMLLYNTGAGLLFRTDIYGRLEISWLSFNNNSSDILDKWAADKIGDFVS